MSIDKLLRIEICVQEANSKVEGVVYRYLKLQEKLIDVSTQGPNANLLKTGPMARKFERFSLYF